ncbi:hypothetical protein cand_006490 [Cryptosporidium andersoni]|uniref:CNNM transmembrane domain-containing protein n=1 Tax=Cryptosporidium andersoni TaxID=117008 RepID=A0A1J4MS31_9CRYT|nr:hypothetical protein cand_006490 [Cryptosporidium andersoni]
MTNRKLKIILLVIYILTSNISKLCKSLDQDLSLIYNPNNDLECTGVNKDLTIATSKLSSEDKIHEFNKKNKTKYEFGSFPFYICTISSIFLVILGGIVSGLTTGFMALDNVQLRVLKEAGTEDERKWASITYNMIQKHHLLLVTLLLTNALCMETLPLFLDRIIPSWGAVLISVTAILIFGEVLPQAICTGTHQLQITAAFSPFVKFLMILLFIFSWPVSKLLDYFLGKEGKSDYFYARRQLKALIALHRRTSEYPKPTTISLLSLVPTGLAAHSKRGSSGSVLESPFSDDKNKQSTFFYFPKMSTSLTSLNDTKKKDSTSENDWITISLPPRPNMHSSTIEKKGLAYDEVTIIQGALDMATKNLLDISVPLEEVYMLPIDAKLDRLLMEDILRVGHSRIPIYSNSRHNIKGLLLVKSLITIDPEDEVTIKSLIESKLSKRYIIEPIFASPYANPYDALNIFQQGRCHIAILTHYVEEYTLATQTNNSVPSQCEILGIATLEDIIEELIQEEIVDEFDMKSTFSKQDNLQYNSMHSFATQNKKMLLKLLQDRGNKKLCRYKEKFYSTPELYYPLRLDYKGNEHRYLYWSYST